MIDILGCLVNFIVNFLFMVDKLFLEDFYLFVNSNIVYNVDFKILIKLMEFFIRKEK